MSSYTNNQDEYFDTYTSAGVKRAPMQRGDVHSHGIWHRAVNVMLYRSNGELVLQQRAASKRVCPRAWDLSVAEHLQVGESWVAAAHRGLAEELGLHCVALVACGPEIQQRYHDPAKAIRNYEFQRCFRGVSDAKITIDPTEVAGIRSIDLKQLKQEIAEAPTTFTPWLIVWARTLKFIGPE
jgi:isopentenyl-diphosphate delta-isomerase